MQRGDAKRGVAWCCMFHTIQEVLDKPGIYITADSNLALSSVGHQNGATHRAHGGIHGGRPE